MMISEFNREEHRKYLLQIADAHPGRSGELMSLLALRAAARSLPFAFTRALFDWIGDKDGKIPAQSEGDVGSPAHRIIELLDIYEVLNGKSVKYVDVFSRNYYGIARNLGRNALIEKFAPFLMSIYSCSYALAARAYSDDVNVCIGYTLAALSSSILNPVLLEEALADLQEISEGRGGSNQFNGRLWRASSEIYKDKIDLLAEFTRKIPYFQKDKEVWLQLKQSFISLTNLVQLPKDFLDWLNHELLGGNESVSHGASNISNREAPANVDKLNRARLAEVLAKNLTHSENSHHRTIGLLGDWGSGKSTVLNLLKDKIRNRRAEQSFIFGEFNAWAYEHTDNIQAGVAQEVLNALTTLEREAPSKEKKDEVNLGGPVHDAFGSFLCWLVNSIQSLALRFWIIFWYSMLTQKLKLLKSVFVLMVAILPSTLASQKNEPGWYSWFGMLSSENKSLLDNILFQLLWVAGFGIYFLKEVRSLMANPLSKELLTYIRLPDYAKHLGDIPVMRENIKVMCNIRLGRLCGKPKRMLFVIDDLDRCSHGSIVKVLEAIRLVLELDNVIVLIAIDQNIALAALSDHFKEFSEHHKLKNSHAIAREYLSKIINLPIVLAEPSASDVKAYLEHLWPELPVELNVATANESGPSQGQVVMDTQTNMPVTNEHLDAEISIDSDFLKDGQVVIDRLPSVQALSKEHRESFIDWVTCFGLTNPRQLKRLNNSYDLMLGYIENMDKNPVTFSFPKESSKQIYPMMLTLILMEYLNSFEDLDLRGRLWKKLFLREGVDDVLGSANITVVDPGVFKKTLVTPPFVKAYREMLQMQDCKDLPAKVEAFVLPAMV